MCPYVSLEEHVDEEIGKLNDSTICLESHMIHEIEAIHETMVARLKVQWDDLEAETLQSNAPAPLKH